MSQYNPPNTANWVPGLTVGVPGGIPTSRTHLIDVTQAPYNADKTGATDASPAINSAINAAVTNDVVYLPDGTYKCISTISIPFTKNNITLRGQSLAAIVDSRAGRGIQFGIGVNWLDASNPNSTIVSGLVAGSTSIVVANGSGFVPNRTCLLILSDDPSIPVVSTYGYRNLVSFTVQVVAVSGNTLTISPPIPFTPGVTSGASIRQFQLQTPFGIGVETLTVDGANSGNTMQAGIWNDGSCYASWVLGTKVINHTNYGIANFNSSMIEIRQNFVGASTIGTNHSGILHNTVTGGLVEHNYVTDNFPGLEVNFASVGNVFAYNYFRNAGKGMDTNHAPHNCFNLYEGNVTPNFQCDGYFGGTSDDTFFRNWLNGFDGGVPVFSASLNRMTRAYNLVGNVVGTSGQTYPNDGISVTGNPNLGNGSGFGHAQPSIGAWWRDMVSAGVTPYRGTITSRTDANHGQLTLSSGTAANLTGSNRNDNIIILDLHGTNVPVCRTYVMSVSGNVLTLDSTNGGSSQLDPIPSISTDLDVWAGPGGFQEFDDDVAASTNRKANGYIFYGGIPAGESIGSQTLANSLFRASPDAIWGSLAWPPFSPTVLTPPSDSIPAVYFANHGAWPVSGPPTQTTASVNAAGTQMTVNFSASCTAGVDGANSGLVIAADGGAVSATYASGNPGSSFVYNLSRVIGGTEVVLLSYTQGGNGIKAVTGGLNLATFSGHTVTNGSTIGAPVITLNPVSQTVPDGANVTFTANATGTPTPTWQWYKNGVAIGGATSASLVLNSVTALNDGSYAAKATNTNGFSVSSGAILTVLQTQPFPKGKKKKNIL